MEDMTWWPTDTNPRVVTAVFHGRLFRGTIGVTTTSAIDEVWRRHRARRARGAGRYVAVYLARNLLGVQVGDGSFLPVLGNLVARGRRNHLRGVL